MKALIGVASSPNFTSMPPLVISLTVAVTIWPLWNVSPLASDRRRAA